MYYIPMEDWNLIKSTYPGINDLSSELPQWQKDLDRYKACRHPIVTLNVLRTIDGLFKNFKQRRLHMAYTLTYFDEVEITMWQRLNFITEALQRRN